MKKIFFYCPKSYLFREKKFTQLYVILFEKKIVENVLFLDVHIGIPSYIKYNNKRIVKRVLKN